ncbi:MAG: DUF2252 domain-containing protein [Acidimicrobiales bacterium]|jgi:nitroreductase
MTTTTPQSGTATPKAPKKLVHLPPRERSQLGKEARARVPRASHAAFEPASTRPDPVSLLERQAESRVPELVPIRYGRMLVSPFTFYRGAALIMASDLATTPVSGLTTQICGDAHLSNFGLFASPERSMMFDVNDFDETLPGPWEWDLKRLAASVVIAGRDQSFSKKDCAVAAKAVGTTYRLEMRRLAESGNLDVWYSHVDIEAVIAGLATQASKQKSKVAAQMASKATSIVAKSRTKDSLQAQEKLTEVVGGRRRIISDPPLIVPLAELSAEQEPDALLESLHQLVRSYRRTLQTDRRHLVEEFELIDVARKVVGVGSVGTRAWILLFQGRDGDDPLFLQAKEAEASVLEEFVGKSTYASHGERVVAGQHLMQAASDIFLGWQRVEGFDGVSRDYYLRQLRDWKGSFEIEGARPEGLAAYATVCAQALARAHARSGDRIAIASYLGNSSTFDTALVEFSETYADQNERDYDVLKKAVADGRVRAKTGL